MASRPTKLKLLPRTTVKSKNMTRLMGQLAAGDGVTITKSNGISTITFSVLSYIGTVLQGWSANLQALADSTMTASGTKFWRDDGTWSVPPGVGDVIGPASATDSGFAKFNGTTGKLLKDHAATVALASEVSGDLPFANLTQGSALSVLGVAGNATADHASIAAGTDNQVLRRSGTSVGFGAVNLAQSAAVTGTLPIANGGTGGTTAATAQIALGVREVLTANRNYYVRTDGSDSNTGLVNSAGGAFVTPQKAWDTIAKALDLNGFTAIVNIGAGTYGRLYATGHPPGQSSGLNIVIIGDVTTPANVVFSVADDSALIVGDSGGGMAQLYCTGVKFTTSGAAGSGVEVFYGSSFYNEANEFGTIIDYGIYHHTGGYSKFINSSKVSGSSKGFVFCSQNSICLMHLSTLVYSNTPAFSDANFSATNGSILTTNGMTFTNGGTVTGKRFNVTGNAQIITGQTSRTYLPGSVVGTQSSFGFTESGPVSVQGTATNDSPTVGDVGEVLSASLLTGSATSLSTGTSKTIISLSLPPGDYEVDGTIHFASAATTSYNYLIASISETANTRDTAVDAESYHAGGGGFVPGASVPESLGIGPKRKSLASTTTVYLVANAAFTVSTMAAYGVIFARRIR